MAKVWFDFGTRTYSGNEQVFDHVVLACHADQALALLDDPTQDEGTLLGSFGYTRNRAVLHRDTSLMPRRRSVWASWDYLGRRKRPDELVVTYWMNRLQGLTGAPPLFLTLNPTREPASATVLWEEVYHHPRFDADAMRSQSGLWSLQGQQRTWFCGAYFGAGFHEDGLQSGLAVAEQLGSVRRPWSVPNESGRITITPTHMPELLSRARRSTLGWWSTSASNRGSIACATGWPEILLDLDAMPSLRLFSHNRFNCVSFYDRDHLDGSSTALRDQIEQALVAAGLQPDGGAIRLLCMPRIFGHAFNPISVFFCHRHDGSLMALLYEVNNTFGQRHFT